MVRGRRRAAAAGRLRRRAARRRTAAAPIFFLKEVVTGRRRGKAGPDPEYSSRFVLLGHEAHDNAISASLGCLSRNQAKNEGDSVFRGVLPSPKLCVLYIEWNYINGHRLTTPSVL
jgi:hypothetical protein